MIVGWMFYSIMVAAVAALAAHVLENAARLVARPTRWLWVAAMASSASASVAALFVPVGLLFGFIPRRDDAPWLSDAAGSFIGAYDRAGQWDAMAYMGMWVASALLAAVFAVSISRLARRSRTWKRVEIDGQPILVSENEGPAVIGLLRSAIVIPQWAMSESDHVRKLILAHELEHQRSRDHLMCAFILVLTVAQPWNPAVWWMARRLRLAVEVDCDARVLDRGSDRRTYGLLLLEAGTRAAKCRLPLPALSTPVSSLEERLRVITAGRQCRRSRAVRLALVAAVLVVTAAFIPTPSKLHCVLQGLGFWVEGSTSHMVATISTY